MSSKKHNKKKRKQSQPKPLAVKDEPKSATTQHTCANQENEVTAVPEQKRPSWIPAATLFIGVVVAVIYFCQLRAMQYSNKISRESLESVQRAFVNFDKITINRSSVHTPAGDVRRVTIKALWENSGTTPAIRVVRAIGVNRIKDEPTEEQFLPEHITPDAALSVIAPKKQTDSGTIVLDEDALFGDTLTHTVTEASNRKMLEAGYVFIWGWMTYRDIFRETKAHLTEFCEGLHNITVPDAKDAQPTLDFIACHRHNCTDEQCDDYQQVLKLAETVK
jgi:hypothetical protein